MAEPQISQMFPVKPKQKPKARTPKQTAESKYWSSFKTKKIPDLISSINSIAFSPAAPHSFAATHSTSLTFYNPLNHFSPISSISLPDVVSSASFRSDGRLIAAASLSGLVQVFDVKTRTPLRRLRANTRPVRFVKYAVNDKLHLVSGGDDAVVRYWDVAGETQVCDFTGHKDYVRCGDWSPDDPNMFVTGSYDHTVKLWDVRDRDSRSVREVNHGKPVEDVVYLPSGGLIATAGGDSVKIWDLVGGGRLVYSMESHNKTVTSICLAKIGKVSGVEAQQYRILSVALDGYMKVFDFANFKVTHSMRFPAPLMSVGFSPDCLTRVIGTSNGIIYAGSKKGRVDGDAEEDVDRPVSKYERRLNKLASGNAVGLGPVEAPLVRVLKPTGYRYFDRGQSEKPSETDYLVMRRKKVKLGEHDKLLKKFRHREALVSVLGKSRNAENAVAVMEELVSRKKLLKCASNLDSEELGVLLMFLQKYSTMPRYSKLLMGLAEKVVEMRAEDIRASDKLKVHVRNLKRTIDEEIRIQQALQEIQGVISPLLRISGRR